MNFKPGDYVIFYVFLICLFVSLTGTVQNLLAVVFFLYISAVSLSLKMNITAYKTVIRRYIITIQQQQKWLKKKGLATFTFPYCTSGFKSCTSLCNTDQ